MKHSETEMRDSKVPSIHTIKELIAYINAQVGGEHDYGTCVYAMSLSAVAAFQYAAHKLGVTGFQWGCADLDVISRLRNIDGPFMLVKGEDFLFPQNDPVTRINEVAAKWGPWLKEEATKKLLTHNEAHPDVLRHWADLAYPDDAEKKAEVYGKAKFLENEFTSAFVDHNAERFKYYKIHEVRLMDGDITKADSCKDGCMHRLNLPVSLEFSYVVKGVTVSWTLETEKPHSNGLPALAIDEEKLWLLIHKAKPEVAEVITAYLGRAKEAMKDE